MTILKAPFPAFGGKSAVAELVWERLGDVSNYIEPFCFSAAMLLRRPTDPHIETINDANAFVANFWRATQRDMEAVVDACDGPVNETDLHARHRWLMFSDEAQGFRENMIENPEYYHAKIAGWWAWGACCWIGSGWCADQELRVDGMPREKIPHLDNPRGVHVQLPDIGDAGRGVHRPLSRQIPALGWDRGVNSGYLTQGRPQLADAYARGRGVHGNDRAETCRERREWLLEWFGRLRDRLRTVRVCCGDWIRVCDSPSTTTRLGLTGLFLDPPYRTHLKDGSKNRDANLYANDSTQDVGDLVDRVIAYCLERGPDPMMRIAVCGYAGEGYEVLEAQGWKAVAWRSQGGYGNQGGKPNANADRERIFFSAACIDPDFDNNPLFRGME